jgi:hypothetical protein
MQAHLEEREDTGDGTATWLSYLHKDFRIGHAIPLFDYTVKKMNERN